ncbi:MAG: helix-turn-helix transcriptional regulator [Clostridia bacterium]|nr:helix-turn-helix transcriptional regulator [Clostridia bacterium]
MDFKDRIRLLRREAGLTQRETAERIGVTYRTYQNYEAGASVPSGAVLAKLSALLGVSMDMLTENEAPSVRSAAENPELCALLSEMQALFAGGKLRDEDKKYVIDALTEAFWRSKAINKKYGRKKGDHAGS